MADNRQLRKSIKHIRAIKTWQLIIVLVLMLFLAATFLRLNNTGMIARRNAVTSADKAGDAQETSARLYDLQRFSSSHMNASSGTLYLQEQYNRDVKKAMTGNNPGGADSPQARADAICNPNLSIRGYSKAYQDCMLAELTKEGQVTDPSTIKLPNPALYRYEFNAPIWSPDFAGWSIVATFFVMIITVVRLIALGVLRLLLRRHYRQL